MGGREDGERGRKKKGAAVTGRRARGEGDFGRSRERRNEFKEFAPQRGRLAISLPHATSAQPKNGWLTLVTCASFLWALPGTWRSFFPLLLHAHSRPNTTSSHCESPNMSTYTSSNESWINI